MHAYVMKRCSTLAFVAVSFCTGRLKGVKAAAELEGTVDAELAIMP